jgi:hypothetical protein
LGHNKLESKLITPRTWTQRTRPDKPYFQKSDDASDILNEKKDKHRRLLEIMFIDKHDTQKKAMNHNQIKGYSLGKSGICHLARDKSDTNLMLPTNRSLQKEILLSEKSLPGMQGYISQSDTNMNLNTAQQNKLQAVHGKSSQNFHTWNITQKALGNGGGALVGTRRSQILNFPRKNTEQMKSKDPIQKSQTKQSNRNLYRHMTDTNGKKQNYTMLHQKIKDVSFSSRNQTTSSIGNFRNINTSHSDGLAKYTSGKNLPAKFINALPPGQATITMRDRKAHSLLAEFKNTTKVKNIHGSDIQDLLEPVTERVGPKKGHKFSGSRRAEQTK